MIATAPWPFTAALSVTPDGRCSGHRSAYGAGRCGSGCRACAGIWKIDGGERGRAVARETRHRPSPQSLNRVVRYASKCSVAVLTDEDLMGDLPMVPWLQPLRVTVSTGGTGLACRLCIARYGLAGRDVDKLYQTEEEFNAHLAQFHLIPAG